MVLCAWFPQLIRSPRIYIGVTWTTTERKWPSMVLLLVPRLGQKKGTKIKSIINQHWGVMDWVDLYCQLAWESTTKAWLATCNLLGLIGWVESGCLQQGGRERKTRLDLSTDSFYLCGFCLWGERDRDKEPDGQRTDRQSYNIGI